MSSDEDVEYARKRLGGTPAEQKLRKELAIALHQIDPITSQIHLPRDFNGIIGFPPSEPAVHLNPGGELQTICRKIGVLKAQLRYLGRIDEEDDLYEDTAGALKQEYLKRERECKKTLEKVVHRAKSYAKGIATMSQVLTGLIEFWEQEALVVQLQLEREKLRLAGPFYVDRRTESNVQEYQEVPTKRQMLRKNPQVKR